eukprot:TRINITY_DN3992_c1_g1_i1.p1 TRINITY_DN3992_c1_g1~~TRINITY_DN3992_c1_g1_i1.p1  ORF type:complete len:460 (-),score=220.95 TRINITY_DN3992_c1_g1_i1:171-1550(-)
MGLDKEWFSEFFWILAVCSGLAGVQFVYSIQFAVGTPLFSQQFKLEPSDVSIILSLAGPLSGFIVQPIVGVYSDVTTSRFGRRRPYIFFGAIAAIIGMLLIAFSVDIGNAIGDIPDGQSPGDHVVGLTLAIIGLFVMNAAVNTIQGPNRALVSDVVEPHQLDLGQSMVTCLMGFAGVLAQIIGAQFFLQPDPYKWLFVLGAGFVGFSIIPSLLAAKEKQFELAENQTKPNVLGVFVKIGKTFWNMPNTMARIIIVFFFSWCGYSPFMIYFTQFVGANVYGGDSQDDTDITYKNGVKMGMYALSAYSGASLLFALVLPSIIKKFGFKIPYYITQIIASFCYVIFIIWQSTTSAFILSCLIATNFTAFNSIPFALTTETVGGENSGLYMGVLNAASVVAQTVINLISGTIVKAADENVAWGIAFGAPFAFIGALCIWLLKEPKGKELRTQSEKSEESPLLF